ncbi:hypothetical protein ACNKHT_06580 [Shigella flexneri]
MTGAMFIMAISACIYCAARERDVALRSFAIGSVFGTWRLSVPCNSETVPQ